MNSIIPDTYGYKDQTIASMYCPEYPLPDKITESNVETACLWRDIQKAEKLFQEKEYFQYDLLTEGILAKLNVLFVEGFLTDREFQDASNRYGLPLLVENGRIKSDVQHFHELWEKYR